MWARFTALFAVLNENPQSVRDLAEDELRLAAAALLVHATVIDGDLDAAEAKKLGVLLRERFELSQGEVERLIELAREREQEAVDLYGFTSVLTKHLDQEGRQKIVEMLWEIAMADGVIHEFENNLVWRVSELLGVSTRDRVRLRKKVESREC